MMPRSTRRTLSRPQLCTISVALLDHGEIVPGRGTTTRRVPCRSAMDCGAPYSSSCSNSRSSTSDSGSISSARCRKSAYSPMTAGTRSWHCASSLSRRNSEWAGLPSNCSIRPPGGVFFWKHGMILEAIGHVSDPVRGTRLPDRHGHTRDRACQRETFRLWLHRVTGRRPVWR